MSKTNNDRNEDKGELDLLTDTWNSKTSKRLNQVHGHELRIHTLKSAPIYLPSQTIQTKIYQEDIKEIISQYSAPIDESSQSNSKIKQLIEKYIFLQKEIDICNQEEEKLYMDIISKIEDIRELKEVNDELYNLNKEKKLSSIDNENEKDVYLLNILIVELEDKISDLEYDIKEIKELLSKPESLFNGLMELAKTRNDDVKNKLQKTLEQKEEILKNKAYMDSSKDQNYDTENVLDHEELKLIEDQKDFETNSQIEQNDSIKKDSKITTDNQIDIDDELYETEMEYESLLTKYHMLCSKKNQI